MSIKGKWWYERFLPEPGSHQNYVNERIVRGKILDELGNGFYEVEVQVDDGRSVTRIMSVSDMSTWDFVSSYDELLEGIARWQAVIKSGAELDGSFAAIGAPSGDNE